MSIFFPYKPRKNQMYMMESVFKTVSNKKNMVLESCTGSGKTISVLSPILEYAYYNNKKILYLTRTNAQQVQVIVELRKIGDFLESLTDSFYKNKKLNRPDFYSIGLQGRSNMCILVQEDERLFNATGDELAKICRDRKNKTLDKMKQKGKIEESDDEICRYYAKSCECDIEEINTWFKNEIPLAEEFYSYCRQRSICAYEMNKKLVSGALLVVAPYVYFFDNFLRLNLLDWWQCNIEDIIVIVDEAHNLPEYARMLRSSELSQYSIQKAIHEATEYDDPEVMKGTKCSELLEEILGILSELVQNYVKDEDGLIPPDEFETELMYTLSLTSIKLEMIAKNLIVIGETIRERNRLAGKLPRSYIYSIGVFLFFWLRMETERFVKLVVGGMNPKLEGYCLDPSLATDILNACYASVHMSGTLVPLEEYRDSIGLPKDTVLSVFPSPFPEKNLSICYVKDLTTKYDMLDTMIPKLRESVSSIIEKSNKNTAFYLPSFELLKSFIDLKADKRKIFIENRDMRQDDLLDTVKEFKESASTVKGAALFAVAGGRLSEGLDFPDKELEVVIVVGVPYPKPTARQTVLQLYYDLKFNKGWEYTIEAPTARKLLQCIGRMIRNEKDRGIAVILDNRAIHFKSYIKRLNEINDPIGAINEFWSDRIG